MQTYDLLTKRLELSVQRTCAHANKTKLRDKLFRETGELRTDFICSDCNAVFSIYEDSE